ncbi:MucBP domain-containing protein [Listeria aquatica]|uniref:MucBP domain-containing protein n=1 Tax=Listeria aquatica TaxID=1494960 RepID=A0A841ZNV2_9LIST|nr:MucBP domain-containing protein [Listeria aquatica]MBC1522339.1 MucBP domain-containing protein [Listeria aquatica]
MAKKIFSLLGILLMGFFLFTQPLQAKAESKLEYDLDVSYNPASFEKLKVTLPIPEELQGQELKYVISLTDNFFGYKSSAPLRMKSVDYTNTIGPTSEQNVIQMSSINNFFKSSSDINYQGFTIFIDYQNMADGTVKRVWYNIKFINGLVTAYYLDENGDELAPPFKSIGTIGEPYAVQEAPQIPGYSLIKIEGAEQQGIYTDPILTNQTQEIFYTYAAKPMPQVGKVSASFVDENGMELAETENIEGKVGEPYQIEAKQLEGYQLKTINGKQSGLFSSEQQSVQFVYEKIIQPATIKGQVTVHFLDEAGNKLAEEVVMEGEIGKYYEVRVQPISNYRFKESNGDLTGLYSSKGSEVTLIYEKNLAPNDPDEDMDDPAKSSQSEEATKVGENKEEAISTIKSASEMEKAPATPVKFSSKKPTTVKPFLPTTGDHSELPMSLLGLWLVVAAGSLYLYKRQ